MTFFPDRDFLIEVAKGNIPGHSLIPVIGRSPAIGSVGFTDIWDVGGDKTVDTSAVAYEIVSTSTDDDVAA